MKDGWIRQKSSYYCPDELPVAADVAAVARLAVSQSLRAAEHRVKEFSAWLSTHGSLSASAAVILTDASFSST